MSSPSDQLETLVRQYSRLVHSVVRRVGGSAAAQLGDDVEQQVFLEIWKQVAREQEIEYPSSYIYRAAVRATVRMLKRERHHGQPPEESAQEPAQASNHSAAAGARAGMSPNQILESRETEAQIHEVLEVLAPERRQAVRCHLAGFDVREIMELENWSYHRARNLIARGMADLRKGLRQRGVDA